MPVSADHDARFLAYLHATLYFARINVRSIKQNTGIQNLDTSSYLSEPVCIPPFHEQIAIREFLDRKSHAIAELVDLKNKAIELLAEKREAVVREILLRGDRLGVKESAIPWLEGVPNEWQVLRNRLLFTEKDERGFADLPLLEVSIHDGVTVREFSELRIEQRAEDPATYKRALPGDLVFNKMRMWQGAVGVAPVAGLVSPDYTVARPREGVEAMYFAEQYRLPEYRVEIYRYSRGIHDDRNRLYWDGFASMYSLVPRQSEQRAILRRIVEVRAEISSLIDKVRRGANLVREYRQALISAMVTGQLNVRSLI